MLHASVFIFSVFRANMQQYKPSKVNKTQISLCNVKPLKSHTYSNCDNTYTHSLSEYTHTHTYKCIELLYTHVHSAWFAGFPPTQPLRHTHTSMNTVVRVSQHTHTVSCPLHNTDTVSSPLQLSCEVGASTCKESRGRMEGTVNNNLSPQAELIPICSTGLALFVLHQTTNLVLSHLVSSSQTSFCSSARKSFPSNHTRVQV